MHSKGLTPDLHAYNRVLKACERAADWPAAREVLGELKDSPTPATLQECSRNFGTL